MSRQATARSKLGSSGSRSSLKGRSGQKEGAAPEEDEDEPELEVPQLAWEVLGESEVRELAALSVEEVARRLAGVLSLSDHQQSLQEAAQLDYYVAGYWFAREHKFSLEQTSAFITLLQRMLHNLRDNQLSLSENMAELRVLLSGVGVSKQTALRCFSHEQGALAVEHLSSSLFQHYRLFQCLFSEEQELEEMSSNHFVCLPPDPASLSPPPLVEAIPLELYQRCLAPLLPSKEREQTDQAELSAEDLQEDEDTALLNVTAEEVTALVETMAAETLDVYKSQVAQKIRDKEEAVLSKLSKLEKAVAKP